MGIIDAGNVQPAFRKHNRRQMQSRKKNGVLIGLFLTSLTARLIKLVLDPVLLRDSTKYVELAERWFRTGNYESVLIDGVKRPPLPLFTIKFMIQQGFGSELAGRSLSIFFGTMIPVIGFLLAKEITRSARISFATAFLLIVNPNLIEYSVQPLRENYYMVAFGLALLFLFKAVNTRAYHKWGVYSGLATSIAFLCRYEAIELFMVFLIIIGCGFYQKKIGVFGFIRCSSVFAVSFILSTVLLIPVINSDYSFLSTKHIIKNFFSEENT